MNLSCALNLSSATIRETCVTYVRSLRQLVVTLSCNYGVIYVINVTILRRETHPPHSGSGANNAPLSRGGASLILPGLNYCYCCESNPITIKVANPQNRGV